MWLRHEKHFRNAAFPEFYGSDVVSLPINWNPTNDRHYPTFLVTEFEGIVDPDQFREKFAVNMSDVLHRHEAERFVIQTVGIKHLRGNWFKPKSVVTCTRFPSSEAALRFFHDPEYERLRRSVRDISKNRTTVMFTLTERPVWVTARQSSAAKQTSKQSVIKTEYYLHFVDIEPLDQWYSEIDSPYPKIIFLSLIFIPSSACNFDLKKNRILSVHCLSTV